MPASMAIMAITTRSSIKVKALFRMRIYFQSYQESDDECQRDLGGTFVRATELWQCATLRA